VATAMTVARNNAQSPKRFIRSLLTACGAGGPPLHDVLPDVVQTEYRELSNSTDLR
jgi:hypothetical protein